mgnify:CR=1 FL=1
MKAYRVWIARGPNAGCTVVRAHDVVHACSVGAKLWNEPVANIDARAE